MLCFCARRPLSGVGNMKSICVLCSSISILFTGMPAFAHVITCFNELGTATMITEDTSQTTFIDCMDDCFGALGNSGSGPTSFPEPTEDDCLAALNTKCEGRSIPVPSEVCTPTALTLCDDDEAARCFSQDTGGDDPACKIAECCDEVDDIGAELVADYWACAKDYQDCDGAEAACGTFIQDGGGDDQQEPDSQDGCQAVPTGWVSVLAVVMFWRRSSCWKA